MMNFKKPLFFILIALIAISVIGTVSAEDLNSQNNQTFQDIQTQLDNAENNTTITVDGYYYGNGTPINLTNKNITFAGINNATLDAGGLSEIIIINSANVVFENINFINCNGIDNGAIYIDSSESTLINNCTFLNNSAIKGGAISTYSAILTINNSSFVNNSAEKGGACYIFHSIVSISNSRFINNSASSDSNFTQGGAILNSNSFGLNITNSIFIGNMLSSQYGAGPVIFNRGPLYLDNITVNNSILNVTNSINGPIYNTGGNLTIINSNIENLTKNGTDLTYLAVQINIFDELSFNNTNIPLAYDLRNVNGFNYVTSIKNQAKGGNCWAFGSTAALESYLLQYYNETWDFSENNMKNILSNLYPQGYDNEVNKGGFNSMAVAYWARWSGPVNESDDPYNDTGSYSPENLTALKHVQDILFLPVYNDVDDLKLAILNYGAISFMLYATNFRIDINGSVPISRNPAIPNHIVAIVGWNDTYPGSAFGENVSDGAFIIKNSWGTNYTAKNGTIMPRGDDGYYYMSYYDLALSKNLCDINFIITNVEQSDNYKSNYNYDSLGLVGGFGFDNETGYFANQFISNDDETLAAFSLYTLGTNSEYEAKIYVNGDLKTTQSGIIENPGYHTIKLDNKINLAKDDLFRIEVKLTTPGCIYPIAVEAPIPEYSSKATAEANQSFISKDGLNWIDLSENNEIIWFWNDDLIGKYLTLNNTNVCLKAFTIQQTFQDIQTLIDNAENNTTITLDGYYFGNGTAINLTNKNITFAGINNATLDARGLSEIIIISSASVVFENINFINAAGETNGAIYIDSSESTLINNCTFINNSAISGGAINSYSAILTINNSSFINNLAETGGACHIYYSIVSISNSRFINNSARSDSNFTQGGAILNSNTYGLNITNSTFIGNIISSQYGLGPVIFNRGPLYLDNITVKNSISNVTNTVNSPIYNTGGNLTIINSNIENLTKNGTDLTYLMSLINVFGELSFNNTNLPLVYDLRDVNGTSYVTSIKDQANGGNCWAFGSIAALESYLLQYYNETWDFSENNMKNLLSNLYPQGYDYDPNNGGFNSMAIAYLLRWSGPVNESDDRYNDTGSYSPENLTALKHVQDIIFIPVFNDVNALKLAILNYGAISFSLNANNFDSPASVPISKVPSYPNHGVCLVGWNDTYPGSAFGENVPDGAFIIKNSWGTDIGDDGYYYMSYYDLALTKNADDVNFIITNVEQSDNYKSNYQYDPLGLVGGLGFDNETGYFANQFISNDDETLAAFSLYTLGANSEYEAKIYVNGDLKTTQSGTIANPGYHTIKLDNKINLAKDDLFRIEVKLTTPGCIYPIAVEASLPEYSSKATAEANQSFISKDGLNWIDLSENNEIIWFGSDELIGNYLTLNNTNVCLKAFTIKQTFQDIQTLIDNAENNTVITLDGYYFGNGAVINLINKNLTFVGINNATLDARGLSAIFKISESTFSFNNINFINGNSNSSGVIFLYQNHPSTINNCTFINNSAYEGGAIYSLFVNDLKINNSKFINNKAANGGALYIFSSIISINNSIFKNNTATSNSTSELSAGGAIFNCNNYGLTISNSLFTENKVIAVYGFAPSIYNAGKLDLNNVTITNSTVDVTNHVNSSIFNFGGYLTINNSDIENIDYKGIDLIYVASLSNVYGNLSFNNTNLPLAYDLRDVNGSNYVTPIKDQLTSGNCWSFGSTAALESYLLKYYNETWDFSENNMKNLMSNLYPEGWDYDVNKGGWNTMAVAYWTRWSGPVNESDDRYNDTGSYSPENLTALKHVQDILFIPVFKDVNVLKLAVLNYGAVSVTVYSANMKKSYNSPIYDYPTQASHMVCIIGWNDTYPGSAFGENVPDGAFIIKNSWGNDSGDNGYWYMSYYDLALTRDLVDLNIIITNAGEEYKSNYQYDPLGATSSLGFNNDTGYFANQFISEEDEALAAFSLYTRGSDSTYKAKIYVNGELKGIKSGTIVNPGYHTIKLDNKINLAKGDVFRIEVELTTPNCLYPIAVEAPNIHASKMTAEANQSFISKDGVNWIDISQNTQVAYIQIKDYFDYNYVFLNYTTLNNTNVCLKAFTVSLVNTTISADNLTVKAMNNKTLDIILSTEENSPVANQVITVEINDLKINLTTDEKGIAHLPVNNFPAGVYEVNFTFLGANGYAKSKNSTTLTIIPLNTIINVSITELENGNYLISGIIKDENGNAVSEGNLDITVGNKTYSNVIINSDGTFNLIISLPAGSYDITFNLTFTSPTFYNNSTLTLKDAIVVKNKTIPEKEEVKTTLSTGNPLIVLLLALIVIPFIRRKNL